jgi:hypothetical protein
MKCHHWLGSILISMLSLGSFPTHALSLQTVSPQFARSAPTSLPLSTPIPVAFPNFGLQAGLSWDSQPQVGVDSPFTLSWTEVASGQAIALEPLALQLKVELWMPSMGHGSAPVVIEPVLDPQGKAVVGQYRVTNVQFIMGGDWEIRMALQDAQGKLELATLALKLPGRASRGGGRHHHH